MNDTEERQFTVINHKFLEELYAAIDDLKQENAALKEENEKMRKTLGHIAYIDRWQGLDSIGEVVFTAKRLAEEALAEEEGETK